MNDKYIISLILSATIISIPIIFGIILPLFKPTIKKKSYIYLYSLSSGFILVLGLFGLITQPLMEYSNVAHKSKWVTFGIGVGGSIVGMVIAFAIRHLLHNEKNSDLHKDHKQRHNHEDYIFNIKEIQCKKEKSTMIILLLLHKLPAGLTLGLGAALSIQNGNKILGFGALAALILHMLPELLTIYYRQIEMGVNKWKAMLNLILMQLILIPFIFIGTALGESLNNNKWFITFILTIAGAILVFTAIVEMIPEFIDQDFTHNKWHKTIILFIIGFVLAIGILLVHHH